MQRPLLFPARKTWSWWARALQSRRKSSLTSASATAPATTQATLGTDHFFPLRKTTAALGMARKLTPVGASPVVAGQRRRPDGRRAAGAVCLRSWAAPIDESDGFGPRGEASMSTSSRATSR